jgi:hypothetical protein
MRALCFHAQDLAGPLILAKHVSPHVDAYRKSAVLNHSGTQYAHWHAPR